MKAPRIRLAWHPIAAFAAALWTGAALAASGAAASAQADAQDRYAQDAKACKSGRTAQDTATCLKEARNARAARKNDPLATDRRTLEANSLRRCDVFDGEAKAACIVRLSAHGKASGSVAGGGVLRQAETVMVKPGAGPVRITPKTDDPVILVPVKP